MPGGLVMETRKGLGMFAPCAAAVVRARALDRGVIRGMFEQRFTASAMARRYVEVYRYLSNVWERGVPIAAVA